MGQQQGQGEHAETERAIASRDWVWIYLLSLMWGSSFMFYELGLEGLSPLTLVLLRLGTATAFMLILFSNRGGMLRVLWRCRYRMALFGTFGCALPFSCYGFGQLYIDSSLAGVLNSLMPLFTYLCAIVYGQERFKPLRLFGLLVGLVGIVVLLSPRGTQGEELVVGGLLCVLATVSYAINTVAVRRHSRDIDSQSLAFGMVAMATVVTLPAMLVFEGIPQEPVGIKAIVGVCGLGLVGTALAMKIFTKLIHELGATNASVAVLIVPFNAVLLGVIVLSEKIDLQFLFGMGLILAALVLMDPNLRKLARRYLVPAGKG